MPTLRAEPKRWLEAPSFVAAFIIAAQREVRRFRPHVIHAHWIVPAGAVAWVLKGLNGAFGHRIPYVVTAHGADAYTLRAKPAASVKTWVMRQAAATVPVSRAIAEELAHKHATAEPVPMGVDVNRIRADVGARCPEVGRLLFVGRLVEKKGVDVLLRALPAVPQASLVVVGDGPMRSDLARSADELGVAERVTFRGQKPRSEVNAELARAAVVCIPSRVGAGGDQDGTPVVLCEAMAAGCPLVVSDIGGLTEYVEPGRNGLVVPSGSADGLAGAIAQMLDDPAWAETLGANGHEGMFGSLDIESVRDRYATILAAAAGR